MILSTVFAATLLAGTHMAQFAMPYSPKPDDVVPLLEPIQYYGPPPPGWRPPRWQRPPDYDRPYDRRDRGWVTPQEEDFNRGMRRFRQYDQYQQGPYRPY
jgi:hypothetical protein